MDAAMSSKTTDLAGSAVLVSAWAWGPILENVNIILTSVTLLVGLAIGLMRLRAMIKNGADASDDSADETSK